MNEITVNFRINGKYEPVRFAFETIRSFGNKSLAYSMPKENKIYLLGHLGWAGIHVTDHRNRENIREKIRISLIKQVEVSRAILAIRLVLFERGITNQEFRRTIYDRASDAEIDRAGATIPYSAAGGFYVHNPGPTLTILAPGYHPYRVITTIRFDELRGTQIDGTKVKLRYVSKNMVRSLVMLCRDPAIAERVKEQIDERSAHYVEINEEIMALAVPESSKTDSILILGVKNLEEPMLALLNQFGLEAIQIPEFGWNCHRLNEESLQAVGLDWE